MKCHYCARTTTTQLIVENPKEIFGLPFIFEEINAPKRQLKLEKTASSKKSTKEG
jgi:hypothetical protein